MNNNDNNQTLKDYFNENANILTVFGIFNALTIFSFTIPNKYFSSGLSFMFMTISVIVWVQLWKSFPKVKETWLFEIFKHIMTFTTLILFLYWLYEFRIIWHKIIFIPSLFLASAILSFFINKISLWQKLLPESLKNKWKISFRLIISLLVIGVLFLFVILLAVFISYLILSLIDWIELFVN